MFVPCPRPDCDGEVEGHILNDWQGEEVYATLITCFVIDGQTCSCGDYTDEELRQIDEWAFEKEADRYVD